MNLPQFLRTLAPERRRAFRRDALRATRVTPPAWHQWVAGTTRPSPRNARHLERLSGGLITVHDLRPEDFPRG